MAFKVVIFGQGAAWVVWGRLHATLRKANGQVRTAPLRIATVVCRFNLLVDRSYSKN